MRHLLQKKCWQTVLILHLPMLVFCQVVTFKKCLTDKFRTETKCVIETDFGYILGGEVDAPPFSNGNMDAFLVSIDKTGVPIWSKNYGGLRHESFSSVVVANELDGYIASGYTRSANNAYRDAWLIKADALGNTLWERRIGQNLHDEIPNASISALNDGYVVSSRVLQYPSNDPTTTPSNIGSSTTKISNDGNVVWSKIYTFNDNQDGNSLKDYGIRFSEDSLLYGSGTNGTNAVFFTADPENGNLLSAVEFKHPDYSLRCSDLLKAPDGNFFLTGFTLEPNTLNTSFADKLLWFAKINPNGQIIWSKSLQPKFLWHTPPVKWVVTNDGGIVGYATEGVAPFEFNFILALKVDSQGNAVLKKAIPIEFDSQGQFIKDIIQSSDGGFLSVGTYFSNDSLFEQSMVIKTDPSIEVFDCCSKNLEIIPTETFNVTAISVPFTQTDSIAFVPTALVPLFSTNFSVSDICLTPQPRVTRTVQFCPGDTVWVAGMPYTQADTLYDVRLVSTDDCDTLATYFLQYSSDGYASNLSLQCPDNIVLLAPVGANSAPVSFTEPWATTDCPCPDLTNSQISGFASGDLFPIGITEVCYRSADDCGNTRTCCFEVKIESQQIPDDYCDEKISGCARFELAHVTRNSAGHWIYRVRLTNSCADPVRFAYFEVPDGIQSVEPSTVSGYIAPSGNAFAVRNPNFSPFYSTRFQPLSTIFLANGQSETFRYALPTQASVTHIHAAVRLASGAFFETYLNTFDCEVGQEQNGSQLGLSERGEETDNKGAILLFPNPISVGSVLNVLNVASEGVTLSLYDVTGRLIWVQPVFEGQVDLKEVNNGIYFFKIREFGAHIHTGKVTVINR